METESLTKRQTSQPSGKSYFGVGGASSDGSVSRSSDWADPLTSEHLSHTRQTAITVAPAPPVNHLFMWSNNV